MITVCVHIYGAEAYYATKGGKLALHFTKQHFAKQQFAKWYFVVFCIVQLSVHIDVAEAYYGWKTGSHQASQQHPHMTLVLIVSGHNTNSWHSLLFTDVWIK